MWKGNPEVEQRGPSSRHTALVLGVPIVSRSSLKKIASSYIYVRQESSSIETNDRAPRTLQKNPAFMRKKGSRKRKKKKERTFALTEGYFLLHCYGKSEKEQFFYT